MASMNKLLTCGVFLLALMSVAYAGGKKDYGEECSVLQQAANIFRNDANDDPNACNTDKGLLCTGFGTYTCTCPPTMVYEKTGLLSVFKGGKCVTGANFPCTGKDAECAANAACKDGLSICRCGEGYHAKDGHCTSGTSRNVLNGLYMVGLLLTYMMFSH